MRSGDRADLLRSAFLLLVRACRARRASMMLLSHPEKDELQIAQAVGLRDEIVRESRVRVGHPIAGRVVAEARPLLVRNIKAHPEFRLARPSDYATPSFACAPLLIAGKARGVVNVADKEGDLPFSLADLKFLTQFAEHISQCLETEEQIEQALALARTDPLTSLLNRRVLEEYLIKEMERAKRLGSSLSVLMVDLDQFKVINDTGGHWAGDAALAQVARLLEDCVRPYDSVFRYGGDEFIILLPTTSPAQATLLVERLRRSISSASLFGSGLLTGHHLTASIGQASFPSDGKSANELLRRLDKALYRAKSGLK